MNLFRQLFAFGRLNNVLHQMGCVGILLCLVLGVTLTSCQARPSVTTTAIPTAKPIAAANLSEVSPPVALEELNEWADQYQPKVEILSPSPEELLSDTQVAVQVAVNNLGIFQEPKTGLGPYLQISVDNQAPQITYTTDQPITFTDLTPGTHLIRVLAVKPWGESFKTAGAYAQSQFHVLTRSEENRPSPNLPLLTANQTPNGIGAEPFLLDFYLSNAPLHSIAQARDDVSDWYVKATINGTSFTVDRWQSFYLSGLKPGKNWIRLELLDDRGRPMENGFNSVAWAVDYQPNGQDARSRLFRGELSAKSVQGSLSPKLESSLPPTVIPEPEPTPEVEVSPTPEPVQSLPIDQSQPVVEEDIVEIIEIQEASEPEITPEPTATPNLLQPQRSWRSLFTKESTPTPAPSPESEESTPAEPTTRETSESEVEIEVIEIEELPAPPPQRSWRDLFNRATNPESPEVSEPDPMEPATEVKPKTSQGAEPTEITVMEPVEIETVETSSKPEPPPAPKKSWRDYFSKATQPTPVPAPTAPEINPTEPALNPGPDSTTTPSEALDELIPESAPSDSPAWSEILAPVTIPKAQTPPPVIQAKPEAIQLPSRYRRDNPESSPPTDDLTAIPE